ncbi:hypothetical protein GCWU000325_01813 [Alloprevotella tannerae ATCC 51259]|uniref:Uncharacterized protein n=1 Tax=Alloprevotella tannerae ATCC 51259 TaxID=626522 RepID=C9LHV9_9BACT|nr:hypothetical protein GCWU000325_01813 [Alloprevotella tannerae ATCC 51259]
MKGLERTKLTPFERITKRQRCFIISQTVFLTCATTRAPLFFAVAARIYEGKRAASAIRTRDFSRRDSA